MKNCPVFALSNAICKKHCPRSGFDFIIREFLKKTSNQDFFEKIGQSLSIRRSFRNWLSEKLLLKDGDIKNFIEEAIDSKEIKVFWKDEILVSVLLSNYSKVFFDLLT
jgi:hypothetical protein